MRKTTVRKIAAAFLLLLACGGMSTLPAQNNSPLDTAPGGEMAAPAATPATPKAPAATPAPAPVTSAAPAAKGPSLLSNGDFQTATKDPAWPDGWGKGDGITWETEGGKHFLRLVQKTPGKMLMAYREMAIPAGTKGLVITIRYRTANVKSGAQPWFDARAIFHFIDASRQPVKPDPKAIIFSKKAATWTEGSAKCVVPPEAKTLQLMPALFQAEAGTLDLAEVYVGAMSESDAAAITAAAAASAKVEAERTGIIAKELTMPSISKELKVSGNKLVTADGETVWLQGVNVVQLSWSSNGENRVPWSMHVALNDWNANVIRLPVMDSFWFGRGRGAEKENNQEAYRTLVDNAIKLAAAKGAYVVLDLHRFLTPDQSCIDFWKDAAERYKNNPAVLFDVFNEPHGTSWDIWQKGGSVEMKTKEGTKTVEGVGMQALVDTIRATGAKNIVVCGGLEYAFNLSGVLKGYALDDKGGNGIMYATHFYNWHKGWQEHFMAVAEKYPVLIGETGADIHKMNFIPAAAQEDPYTWAPNAIGFIQKNHLNWTAWSLHTGATPAMLADANYTPNPFWGQFVKDALHGKQFEMKSLR